MIFDGFELIANDIKKELEYDLNRVGILYRLFSRIKDSPSIAEKMNRKGYSSDELKKMQDLIGFRITTYFQDDIKMLVDHFSARFEKDHLQYDEPAANEFNPLRKNLVCRLNDDNLRTFNDIKSQYPEFELIDSTFEIQFRTTLSEGWHEVEHVMRYKCKEEWGNLKAESRTLNGIYATIETSDHTLKQLFDDISYQHYKAGDWNGMLRNKFRLRFKLEALNEDLIQLFNSKPNVSKEIFRIDRNEVLDSIIKSEIRLPISMNNIVFLCNHLFIKNDDISKLAPSIIADDLEYYFPNN